MILYKAAKTCFLFRSNEIHILVLFDIVDELNVESWLYFNCANKKIATLFELFAMLIVSMSILVF